MGELRQGVKDLTDHTVDQIEQLPDDEITEVDGWIEEPQLDTKAAPGKPE